MQLSCVNKPHQTRLIWNVDEESVGALAQALPSWVKAEQWRRCGVLGVNCLE